VFGVSTCVTIAGGAFSGLAGAFLALSYSNSWIEGMTAGRGWIVIGLTIFSLWNPVRAVFGSFSSAGFSWPSMRYSPFGIPSKCPGDASYLATLTAYVLEGQEPA